MEEGVPPLSDAQLEIMNVVWERGEATVGEIWHALSARRPVARNTIQTLVSRLEEKGWLAHSTSGTVFRYHAVYPRQATLRNLVRRLVDTAFGGSAEGLVMTLLEDQKLEAGEADRIRALIERAEREDS